MGEEACMTLVEKEIHGGGKNEVIRVISVNHQSRLAAENTNEETIHGTLKCPKNFDILNLVSPCKINEDELMKLFVCDG